MSACSLQPTASKEKLEKNKSPFVANILTVTSIFVGAILFTLFSSSKAGFAAGAIGLGQNTVNSFETLNANRISSDSANLDKVLETFRRYSKSGAKIALWLGASQLHAINNKKAGQYTAVWHANKLAEQRGSSLRYLQISNPNGNLHEMLCSYLALTQKGLIPDIVVVAFTYDDLKEPGIRRSAYSSLKLLSASEIELLGKAGVHIQEYQLQTQEMKNKAPVTRNATTNTPQQHLEQFLVDKLEAHWPAYRHRATLKSWLTASWKVPITSLAFRLGKRRKTYIPQSMVDWQEPALDALIRSAQKDETKVLVYKAPHRPSKDAEFYHDRKEFDRYHQKLEKKLSGNGVYWVDLESIVPSQYWGKTNDGAPDVFHFQEEGHTRLALSVDDALQKRGW